MTEQSDGAFGSTGAGEALLALAERCEKAEGPNIALEQAIAMAVYGAQATDVTGITVVDGLAWRFPAYTASLDAAMTLVPEGCVWSVMTDYELPGRARVYDADKLASHKSDGTTPALSLTAAALRARAAIALATGAAA